MSISIGTDYGSRDELATIETASCGECQTGVMYRRDSRRIKRLSKEGRPTAVCCPKCGWAKFKHSPSPGVSGGWKTLKGLFGGAKSNSQVPSKPGPSRAIAIYELESSKPSTEELERELFQCLRSALLCTAAIDGEIHPSELVAISGLYKSITGERVDVGTLEEQARATIGQHTKMLDTLDCLSPYLDYDGKSKFLKAVLSIAAADGRIDPKEIELIEGVGEALNLERADIKNALVVLKRSRQLS